jgi:hypothetical protein
MIATISFIVLGVGSIFLNAAFLYKLPWCAVVGGIIFAIVIQCNK